MRTVAGGERRDRRRGGLAPAALLLLAGLAGPARGAEEPPPTPVVRGPYLQALLDTSVLVVWESQDWVLGAVELGRPGDDRRVVPGGPLRDNLHRVKLEGLEPGEIYEYRILHEEQPVLSAPSLFRTAPPRGQGEARLAVIGDSGSGLDAQFEVAELVRSLKPDLFLHTGDMDYLLDVDRALFRPYREILMESGFYPAQGNHDIHLRWEDLFFPPGGGPPREDARYYSFDWGPAHFIALDSEDLTPGGEQEVWLRDDLSAARASGIPWRIVFLHRTPFSVGGYARSTPTFRLRMHLVPIFSQNGVDLVLASHDHNYQRSYPVVQEGNAAVVRDAWQGAHSIWPRGAVYLVTGGGGQALYEVDPYADWTFTERFHERHHAVELEISPLLLRGRAIAPGGEVLDEFTIRKEGSRPEFRFIRGDADGSGSAAIDDAIQLLSHLFLGGSLLCPVAADVNSDGVLELGDPLGLLDHLFLGGPPPPPPYPSCGSAGADDAFCTETSCRS